MSKDSEVREGDVVEHPEHAVGHSDQVLFAELVLVSLQGIGMLVQQVETEAHRHRGDQDDQRCGDLFQQRDFLARHRPEEHDGDTDQADTGDRRVGLHEVVRDLTQHFERFAGGTDSQRDGDLFDHDDDADGRKHSVHGGDREEFAENPGAKQAEQDLQNGGRDSDSERGAIGCQIGVEPAVLHPVAAKLFDAADDNDDQPGSRAFDRKLTVADGRRENRPNDGREDAGDRRVATGQRDPQAQRQGDEKDEESGDQILFQVSGKSARVSARNIAIGRGTHGLRS